MEGLTPLGNHLEPLIAPNPWEPLVVILMACVIGALIGWAAAWLGKP